MREKYTTFTCDICKKKETIVSNTGFPYQKGWCYIYNWHSRILRLYTPAIDLDIASINHKEKHFCSEKCMIKFILNSIKEAKEIKKVDMANLIKDE